jgi:hypothetical protein
MALGDVTTQRCPGQIDRAALLVSRGSARSTNLRRLEQLCGEQLGLVRVEEVGPEMNLDRLETELTAVAVSVPRRVTLDGNVAGALRCLPMTDRPRTR